MIEIWSGYSFEGESTHEIQNLRLQIGQKIIEDRAAQLREILCQMREGPFSYRIAMQYHLSKILRQYFEEPLLMLRDETPTTSVNQIPADHQALEPLKK